MRVIFGRRPAEIGFFLLCLMLLLAACGDSAPTPGGAVPTATGGAIAVPATATASPIVGGSVDLTFDNVVYYPDDANGPLVLGVVTNPGQNTIGRLEVKADAVDASGATLGSGEGVLLTYVDLPPGKIAPFRVRLDGISGTVDHVQVSGSGEIVTTQERIDLLKNLEITSTYLKPSVDGSAPVLSGLIKNNGAAPVGDVGVTIAGYDAAGKMINLGRDSALLDRLEAGSSLPFRIALERGVGVDKVDTLVVASAATARQPSGVTVGDFNYYQDGSEVAAIGVVRNTSAITLEHVQVAVYATDASGAVIGAASDPYIESTDINIPPGAVAPFIATFEGDAAQVKAVQASAQADQFSADDFNFSVPAQLSASAVQINGSSVSGQVKNNGTVAANVVNVLVVGYDDTGKPVSVGRAQLTDIAELAPGATTPFDVSLQRPDVTVTKVDVLATGLEKQQ